MKNDGGTNLPPPATSVLMDYMDGLNWGPGNRDESSYRTFLRAASLGVEPILAVKSVTDRIIAAGGSYNPSKIQSQIRRAYAFVGSQENSLAWVPKMPKAEFSPETLAALAGRIANIDDSWLRSHSPISPENMTSAEVLDQLYEPGEQILIFTHYESQGQFLYRAHNGSGEDIPKAGPSGVWFLVNPVDGESHPNPRQENRHSRRSEESITSWRYLVLENDVAEKSAWLACLVQLPLKIAAIYTSGGKSIHALVRVDAVSKKHWDEERNAMKPIVVTLGADPSAMTAVRLSRLPGAMRGERLQELLYLQSNPDGIPIIAKHHV